MWGVQSGITISNGISLEREQGQRRKVKAVFEKGQSGAYVGQVFYYQCPSFLHFESSSQTLSSILVLRWQGREKGVQG